MILRKYMSLLGVGSAQINLILQKETYYKPGDPVHGYFLIKGGVIKQQLKRIDCDLVVSDQTTNEEKVIDATTILTSTLIHSGEFKKIPFSFQIPANALASTQEISYHFKTKLTFNEGVVSTDHDIIQVI
ncbi:sporulation protein [Niallia sp. XMNu-256]|uniref:sporulation protein n=1 Tax=Niallia sp. XMNu-256 TaxID=3082444 RepID=UPI0030D1C108